MYFLAFKEERNNVIIQKTIKISNKLFLKNFSTLVLSKMYIPSLSKCPSSSSSFMLKGVTLIPSQESIVVSSCPVKEEHQLKWMQFYCALCTRQALVNNTRKKKIVKAITITLYAYTGNTLNRNTVDGQDIFFTCFNMWIKVGFPQRAVIKSSEEYQKLKKKISIPLWHKQAQTSTTHHHTNTICTNTLLH